MIWINLLLITAILVFIIDLSGFTQSVQRLLKKWLKTNKDIVIKPFMCSLCMTFWTGIVYTIIAHAFTIPILAYIALLSFMTPVIRDILKLIQDFIIAIINGIYNILNL